MIENPKVIYIDNKEYETDSLTDEQKKLFNKTSKWQLQANKMAEGFEEANRMHQSYLNDLKKSLEKKR